MSPLSKEMIFVCLLEQYAPSKSTTASLAMRQWDARGVTDFIYEMDDRYHAEAMENAFENIDRLVADKTKMGSRLTP